jgi:GAF domain-containing protein
MNWMRRSALLGSMPLSLEVLNHRYAISLAAASLAVATLGVFPTLIVALETGITVGFFATVVTTFLNLLLLVVLLRTYSRAAIAAVLAIATISALFPNNPAAYLSASLAVVGAATFASSALYIALNYIILIRFAIEAIAFANANPGTILGGGTELYQLTFPIYTLALISLVSRFFISYAQRAAIEAQRGRDLLQAGAEIGQISSNITELQAVLPEIANLLVRRFGLYYTRIFLLDVATGQLRLAASSGDTPSQIASRAEQPIPIGSAGAVGQAALRERAQIVRMSDTVSAREGWQLHTHAQAAIPLLDGQRVIGVLDAQSRDDHAFDAVELQALQIAANQISTAIRTARLIAEQVRVAEENRSLYATAQERLDEIERLNRQLTGAAWERYFNQTQESAYTAGVTLEGEQMIPTAEWTPALKKAGLERKPIRVERGGAPPLIAVPLMLRGEVIGAVEVEIAESVPPSEALELTQAVGQQLALSLENARLYEETGFAAAQQQRINAIAARMQQTNSVDELLRIALTELSGALGAEAGAVRLARVRLDEDEMEVESGRNGS